MFRRLLRSTIMLAAIIAAYQAYVLFAVPQMEPTLAEKKMRAATREDLDQAPKSVTKYQRLLSNYFPPTHWSQIRPPKVFGNSTEEAILVLDDYTRQPAGDGENDHATRVDSKRFTVIMFPTPPREGVVAPRDAIILESQEGAHLVFDDFRPEMGRIGQITHGDFPGPVIIRSDMHEPGPDDDLLVETSDLKMNTKLLYTDKPVRFRMGQNIGSGRELEIRFRPEEHAQSQNGSLRVPSPDTLEIRRDVRLRLQLDTNSLLPGVGNEPSPGPARLGSPQASLKGKGNSGAAQNPSVQVRDAANVPPAVPKPPVDITCGGSFRFDFVRYEASVDRDVLVRQLNPNGPCDQLTCNELDVHFAPKVIPDAKPEPALVDPAKRQQHDLGRLEAVALVATGHPAVAVSPARKSEARGDRIQILLKDQRFRISGGSDVMLTEGPNILRAPVIDYQQPEKDSASHIGRFQAAGPGSLHYLADPDKPDQVLQATWQKSVTLSRDKGQPAIAMEGRPEVAFAGTGSLRGDLIRIYLRELDGTTAAAGMSLGGADKQKQSRLAPDRLIARGNVDIASPQLTGRTQELTANFRIQPESAAAASAGKTPGGGPASPVNRGPANGQPQQSYQIDANQMQLEVFLRGQSAVPATLVCNDNIVLHEVPTAAADQQPLEVRGNQLFVEHLDTQAPHVILKGAPSTANEGIAGVASGNRLAQLAGRGVTLLTDTVEMERRDNRMWSDGPGEATMLMARDLQGNATPTPTPVKINWQGGLRFDGRVITFDRDVVVSSADSTLHCARMLATLAAPIQFGQHVDQTATSLSQIECQGQVSIENVSRDTAGVTSHDRVQMGRLTINQQTGDIQGDGPGVVRSTRYGAALGPMATAQPGQPKPASPPPGDSGSKLHFLRIDFHTGLKGNMYTRELTFHDRVRTVYGPVDSWEQELDMTRPETLPPESMTLTCKDLRVNEDPISARAAAAKPNNGGGKPMGSIQMQAMGDVRIFGQTLAQGEFSIQADRASYEQAKDLFILDGDTRTPAKLWRRKQGADASPLEARKIFFSRSTNQARIDGLQSLEITPGDVQSARGAKPPTQQTK